MATRRDDRTNPPANPPATAGQNGTRTDGRSRERGKQQGPQDHAEGQHGAKTRARFLEQLHAAPAAEPAAARRERARKKAANDGRRRLVEDRQQHDEAEKNSERTRLFVEHVRRRDDGPSDNSGSLHGVLGHREHRADYKQRLPNGLRAKGE